MVDGHVSRGFEAVAGEFERNFHERGDLRASFAVVQDGALVVDLWGGLANRTTGCPWSRETLQLIFSGAKGLVATCLLILVDRGALDLDAPVSTYWPEFAAHGKESVLVRDVASHRARLPAVDTPLVEADLTNPRKLAGLLATQANEPDRRAEYVYHALTFGWLTGELIRRVDGRTVGRFFAEEVAGPLDLELWIGLPEEATPGSALSNTRRIGVVARQPTVNGWPRTGCSTESGATRRSSRPTACRGTHRGFTARR